MLNPADKILLEAVNEGSLQKLKSALDLGANINAQDDFGVTALGYAVKKDFIAIVKELLKRKADCNIVEKEHGISPLTIAIVDGHEKSFDLLSTNGADINLRDKYGISVVHQAVLFGRDSMLKKMIAMKVDLNVGDDYFGITPLMSAVEEHNFLAIELLINAGADYKIQDNKGNSLLSMAHHDHEEADALKVIAFTKKCIERKSMNLDAKNRQNIRRFLNKRKHF